MDNKSKQILKSQYSEEFDDIRKKMMVMAFYKYGDAKFSCINKLVNTIAGLKKRLTEYEKTGNTEFLADVANFAMLEYMFPQKKKEHITNQQIQIKVLDLKE